MNAIAAVDRNWGIGFEGKLLVSIPEDHKMFRKETLNKVIIYGRKTLETFPLSQPLERRTNIILSSNPDYAVRNAQVAHSLDELKEMIKGYHSDDIYVIGGASVYKELLPWCDTVHITKVDYAYQADAFFPDLDQDPDWEITAESDEATYFNVPYTFLKYERKKQ